MYVYDKSDSAIEKRIAWITKATYWRDSHPFKKDRCNYYNANCGEYLKGKECFHTVKDLGDIIENLKKYEIGV
jgi:hypothetical protein